MSNRKIVLDQCTKCPHKDHGGAFGKIAYIPRCVLAHPAIELPYTINNLGPGTMIIATQTPGIPDWCPLPVDKS